MSHQVDPRGFGNDVVAWADRMIMGFELQSENYPRLDDPSKWQEWGAGLFGDVDPTGQDAPDPFAYDKWQEWAQRLFATTDF